MQSVLVYALDDVILSQWRHFMIEPSKSEDDPQVAIELSFCWLFIISNRCAKNHHMTPEGTKFMVNHGPQAIIRCYYIFSPCQILLDLLSLGLLMRYLLPSSIHFLFITKLIYSRVVFPLLFSVPRVKSSCDP